MRRETLQAVLDATRRHETIALMTDLATGQQALLGFPTPALEFGEELRLQAEQLLRQGISKTLTVDDRSVFVQVFAPALRMIIVGGVHIAQALAPMARVAGFDVVIVDPRAAFASAQRFADETLVVQWPHKAFAELKPDKRTAIVTLTHDPKIDDLALTSVLDSESFYIGSLGSRRTHAKRLDRLRQSGVDEASLARIHAPIGLDIGALTPAEIAVAILGEVVCSLRKTATE